MIKVVCKPSTIDAPWTPSPLVSLVSSPHNHPNQFPQLTEGATRKKIHADFFCTPLPSGGSPRKKKRTHLLGFFFITTTLAG